mgnify:CR=1 FL=1
MKRSEINAIIKDAVAFLDEHKFLLPPFAYFTPEEWKDKNHEYDEIRKNMLGWDITDFGSGDFHSCGLFLFTLRNGNAHNPDDKKVYAEKIMIVEENQVTPYHYHWYKQEDIINRGGGNLMIKVYGADETVTFPAGYTEIGPVMKKLRETLTGIQSGAVEDKHNWVYTVA